MLCSNSQDIACFIMHVILNFDVMCTVYITCFRNQDYYTRFNVHSVNGIIRIHLFEIVYSDY